jgi:hypothetical protein
MRQAGGHTLGQDEASSVVYGMPRVAHEIGAVERQLPLTRLSPPFSICAPRPPRDTRRLRFRMPAASAIHTLIVDDQMTMRR